MKKKVLFVLFVLFSMSCSVSRAQYLDPHYAIYLTSPLGLLSKGGLKVEYRINMQNALLLGYTHYWGFFPGYQGNLEYRKYFPARKSLSENFIYAKAGVGFGDYQYLKDYYQPDLFGDEKNTFKAPGNYVLAGGGIGRHINFDWFFIELNAGLKFAQVVGKTHVYNERLFYTTGPGSIVDFNLHFGVQF